MLDKPSEEIKQKLSIVDIVGEYVQLKKAGQNHRACCPFHNEKTPSFMVSEDKQIFKCFGCFPKGSLVKTEDGLEAIEKIKIGQNVFTHKGKFQPVIRLFKRKYRGIMTDVKTRKSNQAISLTADHKVYVIKTKNCKQKSRETRICQFQCSQNCPDKYFKNYKIEIISANKLTKNDYLLYPINKEIVDINRIKLADYLTKKKPKRGKKIRQLPEFINVNSDLLKLLGYWIAEGSNHRAYIRFSLGNHEEDFAKEITKLIKKIFNLESGIHKRSGKKTGIEITCCNSNLSNMFENLCGKGAQKKHIPFLFSSLPLKKQKIILEAILKGDGYRGLVNKCKKKKKYRGITVISRLLTEQMKDILLRLDYMPTLSIQGKKTDKKGVKHKESYTLNWQENKLAHYSDFYKNEGVKYWIVPIKEIKKRKFTGNVYNLTVNKDHSYTTTNFTVGNCGEGGDIFSFVTKIEGIEFIDALKLLADKAGVELKRQDPKLQSERNKILEVLDLTAKFFNKALFESKEGKIAREYLKKRKMEEVTQDEFMIGYSPDSWDMLTKFLKKKGYKDDEITKSGLVVRKDNGLGYYDRFRGRLMFPIWDVHGSVVGFGGRVLIGDEKQAKYINSPQGPVYDKSRILYGINKAKQDIRREDQAIIVEGYTDVIASHEAGIKNVVSSSGTALTSEQIDLLKRYTNNLVLSFDMDAAGDMATKRGIEMAQAKGMNLKILQLPKGKDPDECIREDIAVWKKSIENAESIMDYYFENILKGLDLEKVEDKKKAAAGLLTQIKNISNKIEQTHYLQKLATLLNVSETILQESINKQTDKKKYGQKPKEEEPENIEEKRENILANRLISMLLGESRLIEVCESGIDVSFFPKSIIPLYTELINEYNNLGNEIDIGKFIVKLEKNNQEIAFMAKEFLLYFEKEFTEEDLSDFKELKREALLVQERLKRMYVDKKLEEIKKEMRKAESIGDNKKIEQLSSDFNKISSSFK